MAWGQASRAGLEIEVPLPYSLIVVNWCVTHCSESSKLCSSGSVSEVHTLSTVFGVGVLSGAHLLHSLLLLDLSRLLWNPLCEF